MTDHIAKANHVIDCEGANVIDRENNKRPRQVKKAIKISQSPHVMNRDLRGGGGSRGGGGGKRTYNLFNINRGLYNQNAVVVWA